MTVLYYITLLFVMCYVLLSTITYFLAAVSFILLQSVLCVSRLVWHISFSVYIRAISNSYYRASMA